MKKSQQRKLRICFQPLTCIRQLGLQHHPDGAVTSTFVAQGSPASPPARDHADRHWKARSRSTSLF